MPFLHVTARIEGKKHDDLLTDLVDTTPSFPSLMVLDGNGKVVGRHGGPRTVQSFQAIVAKVERWGALASKAKAGDKSAGIDATLLGCELGQMGFDDLEEQLEGAALNDAQKASFKRLAADAEIADLQAMMSSPKARRDPKIRASLMEDLVTAYEDGTRPGRADLKAWFFRTLAFHASQAGNAKLLAATLPEVKKIYADQPRFKRMIDRLEAKLAELTGSK